MFECACLYVCVNGLKCQIEPQYSNYFPFNGYLNLQPDKILKEYFIHFLIVQR